MLNFAGALTCDGTRLLHMNQMNQVRRRDDALAGAVLAFARAHESEPITEGHFLTFVGGFGARWRLLGRRAVPQACDVAVRVGPGGLPHFSDRSREERRLRKLLEANGVGTGR
ncbi:hypothetical protein ACFV23_33975 [Streptomyces sp. NPDC059627]